MKKWLVLGTLTWNFAFAALPPFAQSQKEISTILQDHRLYDLLGSAEAIQGIIRTQEGYIVVAHRYYLMVQIKYRDTGKIGPVDFELEFSQPIELEPREKSQ